MFSLFGQMGGMGWKAFDVLCQNHMDIWESSAIQTRREDFANAALGQAENPFFFPSNEPVYDAHRKRLYAIQGYLWTEAGFPQDAEEARKTILKAGDQLVTQNRLELPDDWGGLYVIAAVDITAHKLWLTCDYSGIVPLYYTASPGSALLFSTHIRPLARVIQADIDQVGIVQQAAFGHSIGKRTLFKEISRLNPGETVVFDGLSQQLSFYQTRGFFSQLDKYKSTDQAIEAVWNSFLAGVEPLAKIPGEKGILLSGGLDSRLVTIGFQRFNNQVTTVTLGDPESYEVKIATKVANLARGSQVIHNPVEDMNLSSARINRMISQVEFTNFPYFESAGQILKESGAKTISTGYGGEIILGGYSFMLFGERYSTKNRLQFAVKRSLGMDVRYNDPINLDIIYQCAQEYFLKYLTRANNIFSNDWLIDMEEVHENIQQDITDEFLRLNTGDPETNKQIIERFWFEHQLKQFGRQDLTLMASLPLLLPTTHHAFLRLCSNLDPTQKVDHGIYLKLAKRYFGDYATIPTANIPCNLAYPELILWLRRILRAKSDEITMNNMMKGRGEIPYQRYGWSNFEDWLRKSNFFLVCPQFISWDIFRKEMIEKKISRIQNWNERAYSGQEFLTMITISQMVNL